MKRFLLSLCFVWLLFASCALAFTDAAGREFPDTLPHERTAVLFSSLADIWLSAGGDIVCTVGETVERGLMPEGTALADSGAGKQIDLEALLSAKPDLVLCSADVPVQARAADILCENGIPAVQLRLDSFADYLSVLRFFCTLTGNEEAWQRSGVRQSEEIAALLSSPVSETRVLFLRAGSTPASVKTRRSDENFACEMLRELGCVNDADSAPLGLTLGAEGIALSDPDWLFISLMGDEDAARAQVELLLADLPWSALTAVREGRVVYLPRELFHFKPNARWAEAYRYLKEVLDR